GARWRRAEPRRRGSSSGGRLRRRTGVAPVRAGAARSRPRDPDVGGAADLELPALAIRLCGAQLRRNALARLRRGASAGGSRGICAPRPKIRRQMSPLVSRILVVVVLLPVVIGLVYLGGWWLFALALAGGLLALHELYEMARELRPLVLGGYLGYIVTLLALQLRGLPC